MERSEFESRLGRDIKNTGGKFKLPKGESEPMPWCIHPTSEKILALGALLLVRMVVS